LRAHHPACIGIDHVGGASAGGSLDGFPRSQPRGPRYSRHTAIIGHDDGKPAGVLVPVTDRSKAAATADWDPVAYERDPADYCAEVVGERAWQIAQPGADVPFLEAVGPTSVVARTGDIIRLSAKTKPGAPVSWTSNGLGEFRTTGLPSISVQSDQDGIASADFRLTQGTVGHVLITARKKKSEGAIAYDFEVCGGTSKAASR
jgi:hypothetical protein